VSLPATTETCTVFINSGNRLYATDTEDHFHVNLPNRIPERFKEFYVRCLALTAETATATNAPLWRTLVAKVSLGQNVISSDPVLSNMVAIQVNFADKSHLLPEQPLLRCTRPDFNNLEVRLLAQNAGVHAPEGPTTIGPWARPAFTNNGFTARTSLMLEFIPITEDTVMPNYQGYKRS